MRVRLDLDDRTYEALVLSAVLAIRPVMLQAEFLLRSALGTLPELVSVLEAEAQEDEDGPD